MTNDDCYVCDRCGDEYFFENSYDQTQWPSGEIEYFIRIAVKPRPLGRGYKAAIR